MLFRSRNLPTRFIDPLGTYEFDARSFCKPLSSSQLLLASNFARSAAISFRNKAKPETIKQLDDWFGFGMNFENLLKWVTPKRGGPVIRCRAAIVNPEVDFHDPSVAGAHINGIIYMNSDFHLPRLTSFNATTLVHEVAHWAFFKKQGKGANFSIFLRDKFKSVIGLHTTTTNTFDAPNEGNRLDAEGWYIQRLLFPNTVDINESWGTITKGGNTQIVFVRHLIPAPGFWPKLK